MPRTPVPSPIKAMVWKIEVAIGDQVSEYDPLLILESMKTEIPVDAPCAGVIAEILVAEGDAVQEDQPLFLIETAS